MEVLANDPKRGPDDVNVLEREINIVGIEEKRKCWLQAYSPFPKIVFFFNLFS